MLMTRAMIDGHASRVLIIPVIGIAVCTLQLCLIIIMIFAQSKSTHTLTLGAHICVYFIARNDIDRVRATSAEAEGKCQTN